MVELTQEIIDWYAKRGKELSKMTDPKRIMPQGLKRGQVEVAAIMYYNDIIEDDFKKRVLVIGGQCLQILSSSSAEINKIRGYIKIAWDVWEIAHTVNANEYIENQRKALEASKTIQDMEDKHHAYVELSMKSEAKTRREQRALVVGLWCWLVWEIYRGFGG